MKITFYHKNVSEAEDLWTKILTLILISFRLSFGCTFYYLKNCWKKIVYGVFFFSCFCFLLQYLMTGGPFLDSGLRAYTSSRLASAADLEMFLQIWVPPAFTDLASV